MKFDRARYTDHLADELMPLMEAHFKENANRFYGVFSPNLEAYKQLDAGGMLRIYVVKQRGSIVGYQVFVIAEHMHARDTITATQDVLYIAPSYRAGLVGYKFIKWCGEQLREEGVHMVHQMVPLIKDYHRMLTRLGYRAEDVYYSKQLQGVA